MARILDSRRKAGPSFRVDDHDTTKLIIPWHNLLVADDTPATPDAFAGLAFVNIPIMITGQSMCGSIHSQAKDEAGLTKGPQSVFVDNVWIEVSARAGVDGDDDR